MAVAKTVISVAIIGNAKNLIGTLKTADASLGGFLKGAAAGFVAFKAVDLATDAVQSVLENADRAGDAFSRLSSIIGETNTTKLDSIADDFAAIGVSRPDFLEIVAGFSEFAAASGKIDDGAIADMAGGVAQFAGALGALKGVDPATLGDDIANFIAGTRGAAAAAKELGVPFDAALTPAQRYAQLMERLPGLLGSVTGANAGLDDKQNELNAKWETFASEVGPGVEDILGGVLDLFINIADDIPRTVKGFQDLAAAGLGFAQTVLGPLGNVRDVLQDILSTFGLVESRGAVQGGSSFGGTRERSVVRAGQDFDERNGNTRTARNRVGGP